MLQELNSYALLPPLPAQPACERVPWRPGQRVISAQDEADWQAWRKARKLAQQRERRAALRRIDYHASPDAAALLEGLWRPAVGCDFSSIIDGIVRAWADHCHRNKLGLDTPPSDPGVSVNPSTLAKG